MNLTRLFGEVDEAIYVKRKKEGRKEGRKEKFQNVKGLFKRQFAINGLFLRTGEFIVLDRHLQSSSLDEQIFV